MYKCLFELRRKPDLFGKSVRIMQNLRVYWEQTACIEWEKELGSCAKIEMGGKQGCVFSSYLFYFYSDATPRELGTLWGFIVGGRNLNLRHAYESVLMMVDSERKPQARVVEATMRKDCKTTESIIISKRKKPKIRVTNWRYQHQAINRWRIKVLWKCLISG